MAVQFTIESQEGNRR